MNTQYEIHIEVTYHKNSCVSVDMFGCDELSVPYQSAFLGENCFPKIVIERWVEKIIANIKNSVFMIINSDYKYNAINFHQTEIIAV